MNQAFPDAIDLGGLVPALLDFERMPGRYRLALREPSLLFEQTLAVMQLAAGRQVKGMAPLGEGSEARAAQKAARFFVRMVLLRAGADHYTLLGLKPNFEPDALRDHYRLMIRLTHPDFSTPGKEWPADAASRINIAHGVLGSAVQRAQYDAGLKAAASAAPQGKPLVAKAPAPTPPLAAPYRAAPRPAQAAPKRSFDERERTTRRRRKIAIATSGALACAVLLWLATPSGNGGSLMAQRAQPAANPDSVGDSVRALADKLMAASGQPTVQPSAQLGVVPAAAALAAPVAAAVAATIVAPVAAQAAEPVALPVAKSDTKPAIQPVALTDAAPTPALRAPAGAAFTENVVDEPAAVAPRLLRAASMPLPDDLVAANEVALRAPRASANAQAGHAGSGNVNANTNAGSGMGANAEPVALAVAAIAPKAPAEAPLTMARVQPKLAQVLMGLESGRGENVTQWLDGNWRDHPAANAFVKNYTQLVAGQRVVQLGQVKLRSRLVAEQFVVDGVVELYVQDSGAAQHVKRLQVSAYFVPKGGQAMLTQVVLNRP